MRIYEEYFEAQEELEKEYGRESIVLMMVGSFYEMYGLITEKLRRGKVEEAHKILGMNMTLKNKSIKHNENNPYMVGFPEYALEEHLGKFLKENITVAIYNQYDTPNGKKKERKRTRIYTPSTFIDESKIESNNLLIFDIKEYKSSITNKTLKKVHIGILSFCTGDVNLIEIYDTKDEMEKVESELYRIIHSYNPNEIIYIGEEEEEKIKKRYDIEEKKLYKKQLKKIYTEINYQNEFLKKIYIKEEIISVIEYLNLEKNTSLIPYFINLLQFAYEQDKLIVTRIKKPQIIDTKKNLILNNDSIYQLNLIKSHYEKSKSLYDIINLAETAMGKRCIKERLLSPIIDEKILNKRYNLIEKINYKEYEKYLKGISDIEKKFRKMILKSIHPYELADLNETFSKIENLLIKSKKLFNISEDIIKNFHLFYDYYKNIFNFKILKRCKLNDIKENFFKVGKNNELDSLQNLINNDIKLLENISQQFSRVLDQNFNYIKLDSTEKEGYYLTTTKTRYQKLKKSLKPIKINYEEKEYELNEKDLEIVNLTNNVKIKNNLIKKISNNIQKNKIKINIQIKEEYFKTLNFITSQYDNLFNSLSLLISDIDFIFTASKVSKLYGYSRPEISNLNNNESFVKIKDLRHPIVERINDKEKYITNDIELGLNNKNGSILYGLNMAGKSTLLKALGCNIVLAQAGFFVACSKFTFFPFQFLLSKMTIKDNLSKGQSTFMVEMMEVKNMLMRANTNSLILSDELCSSTESISAHAIVAQTLNLLTEKKSKFIFSTHLHDLQNIKIIKDNPYLNFFHFKVFVDKNTKKIIFDRKLAHGGISDLYGLEVARALGLPSEFMSGAFSIRDELTHNNSEILSHKKSRYNSKVFVDQCNRCGSNLNLHTHHINQQKFANEYGIIDNSFHKNSSHNLEILCEQCHIKEHKEHKEHHH